MKDIKRFIDHLECPVVDGIIFPDRKIQLLEVKKLSTGRPYKYLITPLAVVSIDELETQEKTWTGSCGILGEYVDTLNDIKVICGEAGWGSDGYVAVLDVRTGNTIWIAFFTESNPFYNVTVLEGQVVATSTLNCVWKFDIANPINISVTCLDTLF